MTAPNLTDLPAWLKERKGGLGGSDIGAILGLDPYRSELDVWADKMNLVPGKTANFAMRRGTVFEDGIAKLFVHATGFHLEKVGMLHLDGYPHLLGNPDRLVLETNGILECKYVGWNSRNKWGLPGQKIVPINYFIQSFWYTGLFQKDRFYLAASIEGRDELHIDEWEFAPLADQWLAIRDRADAWWKRHIVGNEPPLATDKDCDEDIMEYLFREVKDESFIEAPPEFEALRNEFHQTKQEAGKLYGRAKALQNQMQWIIGDNTGVLTPDGAYTWKPTKGRLSWKKVVEELGVEVPPDVLQACIGKPSRKFATPFDRKAKTEDTEEED